MNRIANYQPPSKLSIYEHEVNRMSEIKRILLTFIMNQTSNDDDNYEIIMQIKFKERCHIIRKLSGVCLKHHI